MSNTHCSACRQELLKRAWRPGHWFGHRLSCARVGLEPDHVQYELMVK